MVGRRSLHALRAAVQRSALPRPRRPPGEFPPNTVQLSTLLSIKTGGCPEDCKYCPQSSRYDTNVENEPLLSIDAVVAAARAARASGATRFCMGAAWRGPKDRDLYSVLELVRAVKGLGLESCATLGMLKDGQAEQLRDAGLDYYNHNLDTAPDFYGEIITTRDYQDRLDTLDEGTQGGDPRLLRRNRGHGRDAPAARRADRAARKPRSAARVGADQQPRAGRRDAAARPARRSTRSSSCARSQPPGSRCRRAMCASRPADRSWAKECRHCASSPARTRSSTATSS